MSDNNADFNGAGQVNNPTSDNAAQADYNQPYIPQQNDAQMNHPESQPETPHTIRTPPHTLRPHSRPRPLSRHTVSRRLRPRHTVRLPSIPSRLSRPRPPLRYTIRTPHRTTSTVSMTSRPSLPNLRSRRTVSRQPRRMTPTTLTPSRITIKRTTDSRATRPRLQPIRLHPARLRGPVLQPIRLHPACLRAAAGIRPARRTGRIRPEVETGSRSAWHLPGLLRRAQLLLGQHRQGRGTAAADRHRLDSHHRPSRRRHLGTGGRHPDSVLSLRLAMAP